LKLQLPRGVFANTALAVESDFPRHLNLFTVHLFGMISYSNRHAIIAQVDSGIMGFQR